MKPAKWLVEQNRSNWKSEWPRARDPTNGKRNELLAGLQAIDRMKGRTTDGV